MLRNKKNGNNRMWDPEGIRNFGMAPDGVFKFSGVEPEPVNVWDDDQGKYTDELAGWLYPVVQDWTDPETGEIFRQNQIGVVVDDPTELELEFGDLVRFSGLGGFYSRRSHGFKAHAEKIEKVENNGNGKNK